MALTLVRPAMAHMASFVAALGEGYSRDTLRTETPESIAAIADDPAWFLRQTLDPPTTVVLPDGTLGQRVPETVLWGVEGDEFLGSVHFRHHLNPVLEQWAAISAMRCGPRPRVTAWPAPCWPGCWTTSAPTTRSSIG